MPVHTLTASLAYRVRPDGPEYFTSIFSDQASNLSRTDCDRLFLRAAAIYGKPIVDDASYFIRFGAGVQTANATPALVPKFALRCTRRIKLKTSATADETSGIAFWVDLNVNMAISPTHESLGQEGSFRANEDTLSFKTKSASGSIETDYEINRITGALSAHSIQNGHEVATQSGQCEKSESLDPKF